MFPGSTLFGASPNIYLNASEGRPLSARWVATQKAQPKPTSVVHADTAVAGAEDAEAWSTNIIEAADAEVAAAAAVAEAEAATYGTQTDNDKEAGESSSGASIAGDSVASSDFGPETRCARKQPTVQFEGERSRGPSSTLNSEPNRLQYWWQLRIHQPRCHCQCVCHQSRLQPP